MDHFGPFLPKNFHERRLCQFSNIPIIYHQAKKKKKKKTRLVPELTERQSDRQTHRQTESGNFIRLSVGRGPIKQF